MSINPQADIQALCKARNLNEEDLLATFPSIIENFKRSPRFNARTLEKLEGAHKFLEKTIAQASLKTAAVPYTPKTSYFSKRTLCSLGLAVAGAAAITAGIAYSPDPAQAIQTIKESVNPALLNPTTGLAALAAIVSAKAIAICQNRRPKSAMTVSEKPAQMIALIQEDSGETTPKRKPSFSDSIEPSALPQRLPLERPVLSEPSTPSVSVVSDDETESATPTAASQILLLKAPGSSAPATPRPIVEEPVTATPVAIAAPVETTATVIKPKEVASSIEKPSKPNFAAIHKLLEKALLTGGKKSDPEVSKELTHITRGTSGFRNRRPPALKKLAFQFNQ